MSHKPTPDQEENYPMIPQIHTRPGYPGPPPGQPMASQSHLLPPSGSKPGYHPGLQPGPQPVYQSGPQPIFHHGLQPMFQHSPQPVFQPSSQPMFQPSSQPVFGPELPHQGYHQPASGPVVHQPHRQTSGWMHMPRIISNTPPGLEYLSTIDELTVHQKLEVMEIISGFETNNKYAINNTSGQQIYFAAEDNDCCTRNCCNANRPFEMKILDNDGNEVIHVHRPLRWCSCSSCCSPCCLQMVEVSSPPGTVLGTVEEQWSLLLPKFAVKNAAGDTVLRIQGPFCTCAIGMNVDFNIFTKDGDAIVGKISKQWGGFLRELYSDSDIFGIKFPQDLDVKLKAVLLGACFLIDFMFYEQAAGQR